jgi:hypothetical protein
MIDRDDYSSVLRDGFGLDLSDDELNTILRPPNIREGNALSKRIHFRRSARLRIMVLRREACSFFGNPGLAEAVKQAFPRCDHG